MDTPKKGDAALYRGKKYRVDYIGPTKYGTRAKLSFLSGGKSFWVDAAKVTAAPSRPRVDGYGAYLPRGRGPRECACGARGRDVTWAGDYEGWTCSSCA